MRSVILFSVLDSPVDMLLKDRCAQVTFAQNHVNLVLDTSIA